VTVTVTVDVVVVVVVVVNGDGDAPAPRASMPALRYILRPMAKATTQPSTDVAADRPSTREGSPASTSVAADPAGIGPAEAGTAATLPPPTSGEPATLDPVQAALTEATPFVTATHAALFEDEGPTCDVCGEPLDPTDDEDSFQGTGLYMWTRGDAVRFEEPPLCAACGMVIGLTAHQRWEIEEEEG
jgi:hypothetical protein